MFFFIRSFRPPNLGLPDANIVNVTNMRNVVNAQFDDLILELFFNRSTLQLVGSDNCKGKEYCQLNAC